MRVVLAIGTLLLTLAGAAEAAAKEPPVAFTDCLMLPLVRPAEIVLACGDGTQSFSVSRWTRWNRRSARGVGASEVDDCTPSCADGHVHRTRGVVVLDRARNCGGRVLFTRLRLFVANRSGRSQPAGVMVLCPR